MRNSKLMNEVKQSYQQKRLKAEEDCANLVESLCKDEEFNKVYKTYNANQLKLMRAEYEQDKLKLAKDINSLKSRLESMLSKKQLNLSSLYPKYDCQICKDTGIVDGKLCSCVLKEIAKRKNNNLNSNLKFKTFEDCNPSLMSEEDVKLSSTLKTWAKNYPNIKKININLMGSAGSGKTFMLECVASELIKADQTICFKTAFEFNELARLYHIGQSFEFSSLLDADVLFIDDLGSEPMLKNITTQYLYNLINTRQTHNKPTLISTNLSMDALLDRYDERVFSRLFNKSLALNVVLTSADKRIK